MTDEPQAFALAHITAAQHALAEASDIYSILEIRSVAAAAVAYYEAQQALDLANQAKVVQFKAERLAGDMLAEMEKAPGGQPYQSTPTNTGGVERIPTLADLDISYNESSRWQAIAAIPDDVFTEYIDTCLAHGSEMSRSRLYSLARKNGMEPDPWRDQWAMLVRIARRLASNEDAPDWMRAACRQLIEADK